MPQAAPHIPPQAALAFLSQKLASCTESSKAGGGEDVPFVELGEDGPFVELVQRP